MTVGEPFAPKRRFVGPVFPLALFSEPSLSVEAKLLYARLLNYCGDKDHCNPGLPTLARAVALSEDRAGRALKELQQTRLIERRRNGPGRTARIRLIWHPILDGSGTKKPESESLDSAESRNQTDSLIPQNQGVDSAEPRNLDSAELRNVYKEEKDQFEKDQRKGSSSSNQDPAVPVQALAPEVVATTDDEPVSMKPSAAEAEAGNWQEWTEETLAGFCTMLANHRGQPIDHGDAKGWLSRGSLQDALRWWVKCGHKLQPKSPTGYGLYITDHGKWIGGNQPELSFVEQAALDQFRQKHGLVTAAEREAEAERQRQQADEEARKHREAEERRREREERRASYQTMTGEQIRDEVKRLSERLGVVRDYGEQQQIEHDIRTLRQLPAYLEFQKKPAVRRPQIQQELELARQMLSFCSNRPQSRQQFEERIAALEEMLADIDRGGDGITAQATPVAPAKPAPAAHRGCDHRKPLPLPRTNVRNEAVTVSRLEAIMGGYAA